MKRQHLFPTLILLALTIPALHAQNQPQTVTVKLTDASRKLATGDYSAELPPVGRDEVGVLTESFGQMRDQLKLHISDLNSRAYSDALTGVKNKGAMDISIERLDEEIRTAGADAPPEFAFVMFDCNRLKQINDAHGHDCGDIYL